MKHYTNSDLESSMKKAMQELTPDLMDQIWEQPVEKATGTEWYLKGTEQKKVHKKSSKIVPIFSAIAACCVICFLSIYMTMMQADATVYLDVNPSVELQVSRNEKILVADASNQDGEIILENMDLKHIDLDIAVNAILGSMVKHGYLSEAKNVVLLSVESRNEKKAEELRTKLTDEIHICLESLVGKGMILDQSVTVTEELEKLSDKYKMTPGKAALIQKIVKEHPELDYEHLASMNMTELVAYMKDQGKDLEKHVNHTIADADEDDEDSSEQEEREEAEQSKSEKTESEKEKEKEEKKNEEKKESEESKADKEEDEESQTSDTEQKEQESEEAESEEQQGGEVTSPPTSQDTSESGQNVEVQNQETSSPEGVESINDAAVDAEVYTETTIETTLETETATSEEDALLP